MRKTMVPILLLVVLWPGPAGASCIAPGPLDARLAEAPVVFVGTVLSTTNRDRVARVRVEEVWKGPRLPELVEVRGTPLTEEENAMTSVDRSFTAGVRYLFVPGPAGAGEATFDDGLCTATQEYRPDLDRHRPAASGGGITPVAYSGPASGGEGAGVLPTAAAVVALLVAVGLVVRRSGDLR